MKSNIIKYIFIIIVVVLIGYGGYLIYGQKKEEPNKAVIEETEEEALGTSWL